MSRKKKISVENNEIELTSSPFSKLNSSGLPNAPLNSFSLTKKSSKAKELLGQGERLEIRREKSGRGGKTVTTIQGFPSYLGKAKRLKALKTLKTSLGTGGSWNNNTMELQGDRRNDAYYWLKELGFFPVLAGG